MSNYVKATDFQAKDALSSGNPLKTIKGQEINDEYNAIQTAIATKADTSSPNLLGNPTAPTQASGNNSTRLATTAFVQTSLATSVYPVGSIYLNATDSTNPGTLLGFGTWAAFGAGRMMVGFNAADAAFDTAEETGGSKDAVVVAHTHNITDPGHIHSSGLFNQVLSKDGTKTVVTTDNEALQPNVVDSQTMASATTGVSVNSSGVVGTNANLPPYIVVYMWKRTA